MKGGFVIVNGDITREAKISIGDRGYTLGDGLFETIPLYSGAPYLVDRHLARLRRAAELLRLEIPFSDDEAEQGMLELASRNGAARGVARLTVTRGESARGYAIDEGAVTSWTLTVRPYAPPPGNKGFRIAPVSVRKSPSSPLNRIKSISALERVLALDEARRAGADEAVTFTTDGHISSCASANIFWVEKDTLFTPSEDMAILPGVTRGRVIEIARAEGVEMKETASPPDALRSAGEIFVTNALVEVVPVSAVSGLFGGETPGPVTSLLARKYREAIPL